MTHVPIERIRRDGGTSSRAGVDRAIVEEYAEAFREGAVFPPVVVFDDGETLWLADGFHRLAMYAAEECIEVPADVRQGSKRDAVLYSVGANAAHGLRRTNDDKRRAVLCLLNDAEWSAWSNREIARRCAVDEGLVRKLRSELSADCPQMDPKAQERTVHRGGTVYAQKIGSRKPKDPQPAPEPAKAERPGPPALPDVTRNVKTYLEAQAAALPADDAPDLWWTVWLLARDKLRRDSVPAPRPPGTVEILDADGKARGFLSDILAECPDVVAQHELVNSIVRAARRLSVHLNRKSIAEG